MKRVWSLILVLVFALMITTATVTVFAATSSVTLDKTAITLGVGETYTLTASGGSSYKWTSSATTIATVSSGTITPKKVGSATITVKASNGKTATCKITVKSAPTSISLSKTSIILGVGESYTFTSTVNSGAGSNTRTYTIGNASIASRSGRTITAKSVGTTTFKVKTYNGVTASCKVTVKSAPTSISLSKTSITLGIGETYTFTSTVNSGAGSNTRTYTIGNATIASRSGRTITAKSVGTTTFKVKTYNGVTASCKVTVKSAPTSISLNETSLTLGVGETFTFSSTVNSGAGSNTRTYTIGNASIASRSGSTITAKSVGTTTFKVKTYNGVTASCKVTVKSAPTSISLNETSLTLCVGESFTFDSMFNSDEWSNTLTYTIGNATIASRSGRTITAKSVGTTTFKVKTYNGITASCKVTVKSAPTSISLNETSLTLGVGESFTFDSMFNSDEWSGTLIYTVSDDSVASISESTITAKSEGTATFKVETHNGVTATCEVTVKSAPTSISLNAASITLGVGESFTFDSMFNFDEWSNTLNYTISDDSVASISESTITAKSEGTATFNVETYNGVTATCEVTVVAYPCYTVKPLSKLHISPITASDFIEVPYMTELKSLGNYSVVSTGRWDKYEYDGNIYYLWTDNGDVKVTNQKSAFTYVGNTDYETAAINQALRIYNTKTRYIHGTSGDLVEGTTDVYSYDCSGFVSYVLDHAMNPYVPVYDISANSQTLYYQTEPLYNASTDAAFAPITVIAKGEPIDMSKLTAGDLIFFKLKEEGESNYADAEIDHVGMYLGNGEFIHCTSKWDRVIIMPFTESYISGFVKATRMLPQTVEYADEIMYTANNYAAFRTEMANDDENLIRRLKSETPVTVKFISPSTNWAYVEIDGEYGYIAMSNLTSTPPQDALDISAYAIKTDTKLYNDATAGSDSITISFMDEVILKRKKTGTDYYWVTYNDNDYYVYLNSNDIDTFFSTDLDALRSGIEDVVVQANTNFRSTQSSENSDNIISLLKVGTEVRLYAVSTSGTWSYVRTADGIYGFVLSKNLGANNVAE